jgi:phosphate transport system permease protein
VNARARAVDRVAIATIRGLAVAMVLLLAGIFFYLVIKGFSSLSSPSFFTDPPDFAKVGGGIGPQLYNTFYILVMSMIMTIPVGMAAGIYFAEYAGTGAITNLIRRATETLATLPSIIVGLFGYSLFVQTAHITPSRLTSSMCLLIINLPYAVRVTEDALRSLPDSMREGSLALGATKWQTITRVLLPAALPTLITGIVLTAGRVFGEAAALLFAGAAGAITQHGNYNLSPFELGDTLAVNLYQFRIQAEPTSAAGFTNLDNFSYGMSALLVILVLLFNLAARFLGRVAVRRLQGV